MHELTVDELDDVAGGCALETATGALVGGLAGAAGGAAIGAFTGPGVVYSTSIGGLSGLVGGAVGGFLDCFMG